MKKTIYILTLLFTLTVIYSFTLKEEHSYKIGVLKYKGGGDWYANPTALPNLAKYCNKNLGMNINPEVAEVDVSSVEIFNYPFIHMTGHGNVVFSSTDIDNLRTYLLSGGFLHIDDNYGMDKFVRAELKKIFPILNSNCSDSVVLSLSLRCKIALILNNNTSESKGLFR